MEVIADEHVNHYNNHTSVVLGKARTKTKATVTSGRGNNNIDENPNGKPSFSTLRELEQMRDQLGAGPSRFLPTQPERSVEEQIDALSPSDRACLHALKAKWVKRAVQHNPSQDHPVSVLPSLSDAWLLRFARNNLGPDGAFNEKLAWKSMKKLDARYLSLNVADLNGQLLTKFLFPLPGVRMMPIYGDCNVLYMRPCRFFPRSSSTAQMIDNLAYCIHSMLDHNEHNCTNGIALLARMDHYAMRNFSTDACLQFMQMLQGKVLPVTVTFFLIVNPPKWFGSVWNIMKAMLSSAFQAKVKMVPESELGLYLAPGYEAMMPNDVEAGGCESHPIGQSDVDELVQDWILYRKYIEGDADNLSQSHTSDPVPVMDDASYEKGTSTGLQHCFIEL